MRVKVQLFARLRELAGRDEWICDVPDGASVMLASGTTARNNVLFRPDVAEDAMISDGGSSSTLEANLLVDPMVVDAAGDFHLQPGSPGIDQGVTEAEVAVDFDGVPRPQGAAYDMGAFER